jgi:uncharacterized protein YjbI with pentapeptide repeats
MLPMTSNLKKTIDLYIKNKKDISELIANVDIKGCNLKGAIIKYLNRTKCDLKGIDFSYCTLGSDDKILSLIQCDLSNCNFGHAKFIGSTFMRSCKAHNINFKEADVSKVSYEHTDFGEDSDFCGAIIKIGTNQGIGAKFPKSLFYNLMKGWSTNFKIVEDNVK